MTAPPPRSIRARAAAATARQHGGGLQGGGKAGDDDLREITGVLIGGSLAAAGAGIASVELSGTAAGGIAAVAGIGAAGAAGLMGVSTAFGAATGQESDRTPGVTYGPHGEVLAAGPRAPGYAGGGQVSHGYGTHWHAEVQHTDGNVSQVPLRMRSTTTSTGEAHTHWDTPILQPGEKVRLVTHGTSTNAE